MSMLSKGLSNPSIASTSQEDQAGVERSTLRVTLLSGEWRSSTNGDLSTINRELAIQLAKHPNVEVSVFLPQCGEDDKRIAADHRVKLIEAEEVTGVNPVDWLINVPEDHAIDCIIGHGVHLGRQIPLIKRQHGHCKWIQVVHTAPEELGMFKSNADAISRGEKMQQTEIELCELADQIVAVGPKLADAYKRYLRPCQKDQDVLNLTPSIFTEFLDVKQATEERKTFCVLVVGSGDSEDFNLKGYDLAAQAIAELKEKSYQLRFVCPPAGKGYELAEKLLQHGITRDQLIVRSFDESREVLAKLFCEVDLAIMPSRTEGFGLIALEALSSGLPVLVSGNSGLGEALKEVPFGSHCVVDSQVPKKWAKKIRAVREKSREVRLAESKLLREKYLEKYRWQESCGFLLEKIQDLLLGSSKSETSATSPKRPRLSIERDTGSFKVQISAKDKMPSKCAPPPQKSQLLTKGHKGFRRKMSKVGQRSSDSAQVPKQPILLTGGHKGSSRVQTSVQGKRSSPSGTQTPKQKRLLTHSHKGSSKNGTLSTSPKRHRLSMDRDTGSSRVQTSVQGKRSSLSGSQTLKRKGLLTHSQKGSSKKGTLATSPKRPRLSMDRDTGHALSVFLRILKAEYNRRSLLKPLLWENTFKLPLVDVYTRLSIVSRRKTDFQLENNEVNMYDIFKTLNKGEDTMVLVEGSPGIGKTTFCLKISYDWTNEKIPDESSFPVFQLVLLLKCRDIHGDVMEAISEQLLPEDINEKVRKQIIDYIKDIHNQEKILIILDGLDELPKTAETHVDKLLQRRILPFCYVLTTSRQERGIVVRQQVEFDILLQIKGFTEEDAFEYIGKHFGSEHSLKGERLIQAIQENTFLHELPNNPLNLLLLCVVFGHYQGELPSSRTELYQIIVQCLLRRYCAKHNLETPDDNKALEKQFEDSLLVLGELAWGCLLEDRFSFREEELARFESKIKDLAARKLGLVFKEASVKRINPQHEYHFFHKTFQEYLAAAYLAHKLLKEQVNIFRYFEFEFSKHIVDKYRQVFLFVSGILGKDASILFKQMGESLKGKGWDWLECSYEEATFFTESFSESRNAEQMAMTLCSTIPFPLTVDIDGLHGCPSGFLMVANACKSLSQLQHPVHLTLKYVYELKKADIDTLVDFLSSCPQLETLSCTTDASAAVNETGLFKGLSANSSLSSFTLKTLCSIQPDEAVVVGNSLAANKTLTTVTFELIEEWGKFWASALETGLCADTPLTSVVLKIYGSMSATAMEALKNVLLNQSLTSLTLIIYGEMQDSLATAVGEGLVAEATLKSLTLIVYGKLSYSGAISLKGGFLGNRSLNSLEVKVFGELPDNWVTLVENVVMTKKSVMSVTVHPNIIGNITKAQVACLCPVFDLHSLTLNLWGELSCNATETLCKVLKESSTSFVTLNVHGRVTDGVAVCLERYLKPSETLSSLSINIWRELTREGNIALQELPFCQRDLCTLNDCSLKSEGWCFENLNLTNDTSSSLTSLFTKVQDTCTSRLSLTITDHCDISEDWRHRLGDGLAKNTSLTTASLTFNNNSEMSGDWVHELGDGLAKNTSLTTLSLTLNNYSDMGGDLGRGLAKNTSLTTLSLTFNNYSKMSADWLYALGHGLAKNTSLTTLSLTFNNYNDVDRDWVLGLGDGLVENTSLTTLSLTFNNYNDVGGDWEPGLCDGLAKNTSLTTLSLTFNNYNDMDGDWARLGDGLAKNTSLTTLSLTVNNYSDVEGDCVLGLGDGLAKNTSLTTLSLTFNSYMGADWAHGLGDGLAKNTSLTTLSLTFNNYSDVDGDWARCLGDGLAKNTSLTTLSLTFNNYSNMSRVWAPPLGDGVERSTSLRDVSVTVTNYSEISEGWLNDLCDDLVKCDSITTLSFTINDHSGTRKVLGRNLSKCLADCKSLTSLSVTVSLYGEAIVS